MPHRFLINNSLRKSAEKFRKQVTDCQIEYERRLISCEKELEQAEKNTNDKIEAFRQDILHRLKHEEEILKTLQDNLIHYIDTYYQREQLYQVIKVKKQQSAILQEEKTFLSNQMKAVSEDIRLLENRQNELTKKSDVSDIIQLSIYSGYELGFSLDDDATILLFKISETLKTFDNDNTIEKSALLKLKRIVEERSEYLPMIKYISWVIQQKKQFSKQLSIKRADIHKEKDNIEKYLSNLSEDINKKTSILEKRARTIRYFWTKPITYLNVEICYEHKNKNETYEELSSIQSGINEMKTLHSHDQEKWERLKREEKDLYSKIKKYKSSIDSKKNECQKWIEKREYIRQLLNNHRVNFNTSKKLQDSDELALISEQLSEIQRDREEKQTKEKKKYQKEYGELTELFDENNRKIDNEIKELRARLQAISQADAQVNLTEAKLEQLKKSDNRFILLKFFSSNPMIDEAKEKLISQKKNLGSLKADKKIIESNIKKLQKNKIELKERQKSSLKKYKSRISSTYEIESLEEIKLNLRKNEIIEYQKSRR